MQNAFTLYIDRSIRFFNENDYLNTIIPVKNCLDQLKFPLTQNSILQIAEFIEYTESLIYFFYSNFKIFEFSNSAGFILKELKILKDAKDIDIDRYNRLIYNLHDLISGIYVVVDFCDTIHLSLQNPDYSFSIDERNISLLMKGNNEFDIILMQFNLCFSERKSHILKLKEKCKLLLSKNDYKKLNLVTDFLINNKILDKDIFLWSGISLFETEKYKKSVDALMKSHIYGNPKIIVSEMIRISCEKILKTCFDMEECKNWRQLIKEMKT